MTFLLDDLTTSNGFDIKVSRRKWQLSEAGTMSAEDGVVLFEARHVLNSRIKVDGDILGGDNQVAVRMLGKGSEVHIGQNSTVSGLIELLGYNENIHVSGVVSADDIALRLMGQKAYGVNVGNIAAENIAVELRGGLDAQFWNENGEITSIEGTGILAHGSVEIGNREGGEITAGKIGIHIRSEAGDKSKFTNSAVTSGGEYGFVGGAGREIVQNWGTLSGDVVLGSGNDTFSIWNNNYNGLVFGGRGNDTLKVTNDWAWTGGTPPEEYLPSFEASQFIEKQGGGYDTVVTFYDWVLGEGFERLLLKWDYNSNATGNASDNVIVGNDGNNRISGVSGDDSLTGRAGSDTFVFGDGYGKDTIWDFRQDLWPEDGEDLIDLSGLTGVSDYQDLLSNHVRQSRNGVIVHSGEDKLLICDFELSDLDENQFYFSPVG